MITPDTIRSIFLPTISVRGRETRLPTSSVSPQIIAAKFGSIEVEALAKISTV